VTTSAYTRSAANRAATGRPPVRTSPFAQGTPARSCAGTRLQWCHGGADIGPPGVRPEYSGYYYAAFVLDPDGNNVEAVFHAPTPT
jgi:hypothetical protein